MNSNVHLMGAEAVERAGAAMERAAEKMAQAAKDMDYTLMQHHRFLDDWLARLEGVLEDVLPSFSEPIDVHVVKDEEDEEKNVVNAVGPPTTNVWTSTTD